MTKKRLLCGIVCFTLIFGWNVNTLYTYGKEKIEEAEAFAEVIINQEDYEENELIVLYRENTKLEEVLLEGVKEEKISDTCSYLKADNHANLEEMIALLTKHPQVLSVEPNYKVTLFQTNDTYTNYQWAYEGYASINLEEAKALGIGKNEQSIVAVVDTGIDFNHADLTANMWMNPNEIYENDIDDDGNGYVDDYYGWNFHNNTNQICEYEQKKDGVFTDFHGTHVAGIIGAVTDNEIGIAGVAGTLDVKLMSLKVMNKNGECELKEILSAIDYAEENGADICNFSFGMETSSEALYNAIKNSSMLFVCAAGNAGKNTKTHPFYPAAYQLDNLISVANGNKKGKLDPSSSYGIQVDIMAPGTDITSTYVDPDHTEEGKYINATGTSMATPFVSGTAAYLICYYGKTNPAVLKTAILGGSRYLPEIDGKIANGAYLDVLGAINYGMDKASLFTKTSKIQKSNQKKYKISVSNPLEEELNLFYAKGAKDLQYFQEGNGKELKLSNGSASITVNKTTTYTIYMIDSQGGETLKKEKIIIKTLKKVSLPINNKTLKIGKSYQLKPKLSESGVYGKLTYKSSNKKIAKVSQNGKITGVKAGKAKITVTATYGTEKKTAICNITVKKK